MNPPTTYAEWVELLEILKKKTNDDEVLKAIKFGSIAWQVGVAERFAQKLIDTINSRVNSAIDKFQKDMLHSNGQEGAIVQAILILRKEMAFLYDAINLPAIPEKDREQYSALVRGQADQIQFSLEGSAKSDRSGKMSSIINNHKVNAF